LIESYDKFNAGSSLYNYWNKKLTEVIEKERLMENKLIMNDEHLRGVVNKLID